MLLYLVRLSDACHIDLAAAAAAKLEKNAAKYPAERCRGSSAKYTRYADGSAGSDADGTVEAAADGGQGGGSSGGSGAGVGER